MTEFERTLRDHLNAAYDDICRDEEFTPAELDAYQLGATHALEEALALFEVEVALEVERQQGTAHSLDDVFGEVRTSFSLEWEQGARAAEDLRVVDATIGRAFAVLDAMDDASVDCE